MDDRRLGKKARGLLGDKANEAFLSDASVFEMALKVSAGKLNLGTSLRELLDEEMRVNGYLPLPIRRDHVLCLTAMEGGHKDPFDRLLIAQAVVDDLVVLTRDPAFAAFPVETIW